MGLNNYNSALTKPSFLIVIFALEVSSYLQWEVLFFIPKKAVSPEADCLNFL